MSESHSLTLGELKESEDRELIGNQIPQWVSDADWNKPLYAVSSSNIGHFDAYALENFPDYYDDGWTQKQSDAIYLGQGIEMFALDDAAQNYILSCYSEWGYCWRVSSIRTIRESENQYAGFAAFGE